MKVKQGFLIKDALPANSGIFASGGVRLNGREPLFGEAETY
jgi:hypothetical protein